MERFLGRAPSGRALYRTRGARKIERLESRCVLNGGALFDLPVAPTVMFSGDRDINAIGEASQKIGGGSFGVASHYSDNMGSMYAESGGFAPVGFGFYEPPMMSMDLADYGGVGGGSMGIVFGAPTELIVIFSTTSNNSSAMYAESGTPAGQSGSNLRADVAPAGGMKPNVSPSLDALPHPASAMSPSQTPLATTVRVTPADFTAAVNSHSALVTSAYAAAGSMKTALFSAIASVAPSIPLLDGAGTAWMQTFVGAQAPANIVVNTATAVRSAFQTAGSGNGIQVERLTDAAFIHSRATVGQAETTVCKASLAGIPLDMRGIERALHTVMSEMESLGTEVSHWLDDMHLVPMIAAVSAAALGAGATYYLRRRGEEEAGRRDEEASSSWLFARLHGHSG
ncbi:MAG TPA: hypothetical protein VMJ32_09865 [Pirellulales bacterium]|nr:hypothetical protein [Pirellulales bacterium]